MPARLDEDGLAAPSGTFIDVWIASLSVPPIGQAVMGEKSFARLQREIREGDHAVLVASRGRYSFAGDKFVPGAVPDRLQLTQDNLPLDLRDLAFALPPTRRTCRRTRAGRC